MKKFFAICFLFVCCVVTNASQRITAIVTVTNAPTTNGMSITVNGWPRLWTNVASIGWVTTNNTIGGCASNLFSSFAGFRDSGTSALQVEMNGTNAVTLRAAPDGALAISTTGNWASISLTTNPVINPIPVTFPVSSEQSGATRTNVLNYLIDAINQATNKVASNSAAMANFVSINGVQAIAGIQTFNGTVYLNGPVNIAGSVASTASINSFANLSVTTLKPTVITNSPKIYQATIIASGATNSSLTNCSYQGGTFSNPTNSGVVYGTNYSSSANTNQFLDLGDGARAITLNDGTATGVNIASTGTIALTGASVTETNVTLNGTSTVAGPLTFQNYANTDLVTGNNSDVDAGGKSYVLIAGPSSTFSVCGIASPSAGREVLLQNSSGHNMTIANNSGSEATAANRIITTTGADITITNSPGFVRLIYDPNASKWTVEFKSN